MWAALHFFIGANCGVSTPRRDGFCAQVTEGVPPPGFVARRGLRDFAGASLPGPASCKALDPVFTPAPVQVAAPASARPPVPGRSSCRPHRPTRPGVRLVQALVLCLALVCAALPSLAAEAADAQASQEAKAGKPDQEAKKIELFGKMEFKGSFKNLPAWIRVIEETPKHTIFKNDFKLNANTTWGQLKAQLEKLPRKEQLVQVNRFWNRWPYREDIAVYKVPDYWAIPEEFVKNSGDCEDYSIAKYYTLKELGFDPDDMRIAVVKETVRNIAHAVLVVYLDGDAWVLDNLSNAVLSHKVLRNYDVQFSVNEKFRWAHIRKK